MTKTIATPSEPSQVTPDTLVWLGSTLQARDIMSSSPVTITPTVSVSEAQALMQKRHIRHLPVLEGERLVGMVSDRDIRLVQPSPATSLSKWELHYLLARLTATDVMTRFVVAVTPECSVTEAVGRMLRHKIGALPIVKGRRVVGILTRTDVLRAFLRTAPQRKGDTCADDDHVRYAKLFT